VTASGRASPGATWLEAVPGAAILRVRVQPRAARSEIAGVVGDRLRVRIAAPPADGRANAALVDFIAGVARVTRSAVTLTHGAKGREKTLRIAATDPAAVVAFLQAAAVSVDKDAPPAYPAKARG
jgi:uncharacterized protein (TIGR00251 family)